MPHTKKSELSHWILSPTTLIYPRFTSFSSHFNSYVFNLHPSLQVSDPVLQLYFATDTNFFTFTDSDAY